MSLCTTQQELLEARACLDRRDFRQVLALCRPLLSGLPHDPELCSLVGAALLGLGRAFQALRVLGPASEMNPSRSDLQSMRISCLLAGGRFQLAQSKSREALQLAPGNTRLFDQAREVDASIEELKRLIASARRPLLTESQRTALRRDFQSNYRIVPIIVNSRDRYCCLHQLINWLRCAGYSNLVVLDNDSTYPPLVEYLRGLGDEVLVFRLSRNYGPRALWSSGLIGELCDVPFVYTDPDVLPTEDCPLDAVLKLSELLHLHRRATKAGLGIKIDDIPDHYERKSAVQSWEAEFWKRSLRGNCYDAMVDTTFALYRPGSWHHLQAVRSGFPYLVRHLPWYADSSKPTAEDQYYADHAFSYMTSWSGKELPSLYEAGSRSEHL